MDRINGAGTIDLGGGKRGFQDENLAVGQEGTEVTAAWLNAIQEELASIIEGEGLAMSAGDLNLLGKAIALRLIRRNVTSWTTIRSMTTTAPPGGAAATDTYLVPAGATGAWAGNTGKLAEWNGTAWIFTVPANGHGIGLPDGSVFIRKAGAYVAFAPAATTAIAGILRLATDAEAIDPSLTSLAIDPRRLGLAFSAYLGSDNLLINPLFRINQDSFAGGAIAAGAYAIDMWGAPSGVASSVTFANGVATIASGKLRQVIEDPGVALGDVTLQWQGTCQVSINGGAAQASPVTFNHTGGVVTVDALPGTFSKPMMAIGSKPVPFRAPSIQVDKLNCYRHYYVNTDQLDQYVPTALGSNQAWALRYYLTFPTAMRVVPNVTLSSYTLTDRASGVPSPRPDLAGFTLRVDVNAGTGVAAVSNLRFKADARIAL